jgi:hypothetical protein
MLSNSLNPVHLFNLSCPLIDPISDPPHPRGLLLKNALISHSNPLLFLQRISLNVLPIEALTDELMEAVAPNQSLAPQTGFTGYTAKV